MKKVILIFTVFISLLFFNSCDKEDNTSLINESEIESTEISSNTTQSTTGSKCEADCVFGDCSADCTNGQSAYCKCDWGFAECGCRSSTGNDKVGIIPNFSMQQMTLMSTYSTYLADNKLEEIGIIVEDIIDSINDNDANLYYNNLDLYVEKINLLNTNQQDIIRNWLSAHSK